MMKETFVFLLGLLVFFTPYLGVPSDYRKWLLIVTGMLIMAIGYRLRRNAFLSSLEHESGERRSDTFAESDVLTTSTEREPGTHI